MSSNFYCNSGNHYITERIITLGDIKNLCKALSTPDMDVIPESKTEGALQFVYKTKPEWYKSIRLYVKKWNIFNETSDDYVVARKGEILKTWWKADNGAKLFSKVELRHFEDILIQHALRKVSKTVKYNPVPNWFDDNIIITNNQDDKLRMFELIDDCKKWCRTNSIYDTNTYIREIGKQLKMNNIPKTKFGEYCGIQLRTI